MKQHGITNVVPVCHGRNPRASIGFGIRASWIVHHVLRSSRNIFPADRACEFPAEDRRGEISLERNEIKKTMPFALIRCSIRDYSSNLFVNTVNRRGTLGSQNSWQRYLLRFFYEALTG